VSLRAMVPQKQHIPYEAMRTAQVVFRRVVPKVCSNLNIAVLGLTFANREAEGRGGRGQIPHTIFPSSVRIRLDPSYLSRILLVCCV